MRFTVQLPTDKVGLDSDFLSGEAIGAMARAAESAGFDACFVTDHPIPDDRWLASGGHHALDAFVALSFAAAATTRIRLHTHVQILPYRNPFLTAKAAASLDVASGGRLVLGVATGYLESEFRALGVDLDQRNELTDEALTVMKRVWSEEGLRVEGRGFEAQGNTSLPRPLQKPHPPIWVGGNSKRAIRRAVELGDGWAPFPAPRRLASHVRTASIANLADLEQRIAYARDHAASVGRAAPLDICFAPLGFELFAEKSPDPEELHKHLAELEALGVTWLALSVGCESRADYCEKLERFGEQVLCRR